MPPKRRPVAQLAGESHSKVPRSNGAAYAHSSSQIASPYNSQHHYSTFDQSAPPSSLGHVIRPSPRSPWVIDDDGDDAPEPSQGADTSSFELYGTLENKVVGVRWYQGVVNPGERVLCRREPSNPYDRNAIRVDNVMRTQIGHIPAKVAAKIAPYIDNHEIALEGVLTGEKGTFDCPVRLYFYGTSDPIARLQLEERLKADKLVKATQLKQTRKDAEAQRNTAMRLRVNATTVGLPGDEIGQQGDALGALLAESEAVRLRGDLGSVDVFAMNEDALSKLPKARQPEAIQSQLLPYQLQGLAWMASKENPQPPAPGSKDIVQLWKRTDRGNFVNLVSNHITKDPPQLALGGVLADDMGLGKTIQVISLIMSTVSEGPTLIVAPVGVISNWEQQIQRHVKDEHKPSVFRYHKPGNYSSGDLSKHGIVITTYDKVRGDQAKGGPLFSVDWRRIVLDEAHAIRNYSTARAKAVFQLKAKSRWMLSGTPIVNSPKDFLSALKFLQITGGIEEAGFFLRMIDRPLLSGLRGADDNSYKLAAKLFQLLTADLCLRRRKDMKFVDLKLPAKTEYIHRIKFREDEQDKYKALLSETTHILEMYRQRNQNGPQIRFTNVLEKLLRLRQMCCHWTLCGGHVKDILRPLEKEKVVAFTPENLKILQQALLTANNEGEECPICTDALSLHDPIITACKHRFGRPCLLRAFERDTRCPMCRQQLTQDSLVGLEPVGFEEKFDGDTRSSKTEALEKILKAKLKDPKSKVVVFSQWTSFLNIIAKLLDEGGYKYCRLEGSMTVSKRDESVDALTNDPNTRIMLASLAASGVGLNLVAADTVILADSWWAPAVEDQAIDRVHRLGQTRETTVWKLVMDGSVEERVLGIQAKKRELVNLALNDRVREQTETNRLDDVLQLLS